MPSLRYIDSVSATVTMCLPAAKPSTCSFIHRSFLDGRPPVYSALISPRDIDVAPNDQLPLLLLPLEEPRGVGVFRPASFQLRRA